MVQVKGTHAIEGPGGCKELFPSLCCVWALPLKWK